MAHFVKRIAWDRLTAICIVVHLWVELVFRIDRSFKISIISIRHSFVGSESGYFVFTHRDVHTTISLLAEVSDTATVCCVYASYILATLPLFIKRIELMNAYSDAQVGLYPTSSMNWRKHGLFERWTSGESKIFQNRHGREIIPAVMVHVQSTVFRVHTLTTCQAESKTWK